jgi:hypothetical protein
MTLTRKSLALVLVGISAALVACSGGGGGSSSSGGGGGGTGTGDTSFSVTDASSDQIETFAVDVTDISLTRPDGAILHTLPATQRVDFADLVNESQLLTSYGALAGVYTKISMTLDFSTANVVLAGQSTPAKITDQSGNPVTGPITLPIQFPNGQPLVVTPGAHRLISLDFDLDGSCAINVATNTVQLGAVIKAEAQPSQMKPHNVYGTLAAVNTGSQSLTITLNGPADLVTGPSFTINTTSTTIWFVDGQPAVGAAGFALASGQPLKSAVLAQGTPDPVTRSVTAAAVEMWIQKDIVHGHVVGRDQNGNLTVRGLSVEFANNGTQLSSTVLLNQTITVMAGQSRVYERFTPKLLDHNAIGVGQRIFARGTFNQATMTMDCSQGEVLLPETGIFGFLNAPSSGGTLTMNVARFGRRPISDFNFTVNSVVTADPTAYVVNLNGFGTLTGALNVSAIASGAPIAVRGLVAPWNQTPPGSTGLPYNASAVTVVDRSAFALLYMSWPIPLATDVTATTGAVTLDSTASSFHFVDPGFIAPLQITGTATLVPSSTLSFFAIGQDGGLTLYIDFASFEADLASRLAAGAKGKVVAAIGSWSASNTTLTANRIAVFLR